MSVGVLSGAVEIGGEGRGGKRVVRNDKSFCG